MLHKHSRPQGSLQQVKHHAVPHDGSYGGVQAGEGCCQQRRQLLRKTM
jgi:hypothetical protein